jgi:hypothetical protein
MRVERGVRKTICLQIEGVSKRYDGAYTGDEMTTLGTVLFEFDLIMYIEIGSCSCVCTLSGVCRKTGRRLPSEAGIVLFTTITTRVQGLPSTLSGGYWLLFRSVRHEADY